LIFIQNIVRLKSESRKNMNIKPGTNRKNKIHRGNKWETYERYKKKLSCKHGWDSEQGPDRYERAVKVLCKIMKL